MFSVLLDFNGTMIFDSSLHQEAWSKIYWELFPNDPNAPDPSLFCGPRNDAILQKMAPQLTPEQRNQVSEYKEGLYRQALRNDPAKVPLVNGLEPFLDTLIQRGIPFGLASASIRSNIDFFYDHYALGRWFRKDDIVYDDGTYPDKGAMHIEAARRLNVPLSKCLLVEDSTSSIRLAKKNGAGCIVAIGDAASAPDLLALGADYVIRDFTQFDFRWLENKIPVP